MRFFTLCVLMASVLSLNSVAAYKEILYPGKAFAKLDTFEGLNLQDADKLFIDRDYKGAYSAYKAYSFEFADSKALPYVLLRMGRCLHLLDKRNAAIKSYQDVVDYFPDDVIYAAAALYHIGECHGQNGDDDKKLAVWARMVKDDEYVGQPNSGTALTYLGSAMEKLGNFDDAAEYHWRTAVAFMKSNETAAKAARALVINHYIKRKPNHEKLKEFFTATNAFCDRHGKGENPQEDARYWNTVLNGALIATENKENICRYWVSKFGKLFPEDDAMRVRVFSMQLVYEKDSDSWSARMNKQFALKPVTIKRVIAWTAYFKLDSKLQLDFVSKHGGPLMASATPSEQAAVFDYMGRKERSAFYSKYVSGTIARLKQKEKFWLMNRLRHPLGMHEEAQSVMRSVRTQGMTDEELRSLALFAAYYLTEEEVLRYIVKIKDKTFATKVRFDYYLARTHRNRPFQEKALAEIPALQKSTDYAGQSLTWTKADLLRGLGRYDEAIKAYRAANRQPQTTWSVTDCMVAMKQYAQAIKTVKGLESVKATASQACLKIADIYKISGDKGKEVQQLRLVLRRYPQSSQSSQAHNRLESYGVKVIGGEAVAEE